MKKFKIALAGNPNCGKTTLFNSLTGSKQYVGNWPGVTVERKVGHYTYKDAEFEVVDLPGIYSFSAHSLDEKVSREFILYENPDLIVNVVDGSNLERNLYLTSQILEIKKPFIVALNMLDIAKKKGIEIEIDHLETHLDSKVVPIVAAKKEGIDSLLEQIYNSANSPKVSKTKIEYDEYVEKYINKIEEEVKKLNNISEFNTRWLAIKLLENDELALNVCKNKIPSLKNAKKKIESHIGSDSDIVIADGKYGFIHGLSKDVTKSNNFNRKEISDKIDKVVLSKFLGLPIFIAIMYAVFMITMNLGNPFIGFFDKFMGTIFVDGFSYLLTQIHTPDFLKLLLANGVGGGIQTVSTFIPPIFFIFMLLAILEDSGYMSRAAFIMDKYMKFIGLPGKAFIPLIVGFGCTVPAIMASRTLENENDRILTILINPFVSCGARLPVYALLGSVFFGAKAGLIIFSLYFIGILVAVLSGFLFKKTFFSGDTSTYVMELPPYHIPTINGIMLHTWTKIKSFIIKAGQVIIVVVIILTILNSITLQGKIDTNSTDNSVLSYVGKTLTPAFKPMGIKADNWQATVGLFTGIFAKESIIGTLKNLYSTKTDANEENNLDFTKKIKESFLEIPAGFKGIGSKLIDPLGFKSNLDDSKEEEKSSINNTMKNAFGSKNRVFAYLLFVLLYFPCVATLGAIYNEIGLKWALFSGFYTTTIAWIIATIFYQTATFFDHVGTSIFWILFAFSLATLFYSILRIKNKKRFKKI